MNYPIFEYKESDFNDNTLEFKFYQLSKDGVEKIELFD